MDIGEQTEELCDHVPTDDGPQHEVDMQTEPVPSTSMEVQESQSQEQPKNGTTRVGKESRVLRPRGQIRPPERLQTINSSRANFSERGRMM